MTLIFSLKSVIDIPNEFGRGDPLHEFIQAKNSKNSKLKKNEFQTKHVRPEALLLLTSLATPTH